MPLSLPPWPPAALGVILAQPAGPVVGDDQDTLLSPDTVVDEQSGGAAREPGQVAVGDVSRRGMDGNLAGAGFQVAVQEVGAHVVTVRKIQPPHLIGQCSFGRWQATV